MKTKKRFTVALTFFVLANFSANIFAQSPVDGQTKYDTELWPNTTQPGDFYFDWVNPAPESYYVGEVKLSITCPTLNCDYDLNDELRGDWRVNQQQNDVTNPDGLTKKFEIDAPENQNVWLYWCVKQGPSNWLPQPCIWLFPYVNNPTCLKVSYFAQVTPPVEKVSFATNPIISNGTSFRLEWINNSRFEQFGKIFRFSTDGSNSQLSQLFETPNSVLNGQTNYAEIQIPIIPSTYQYKTYKCRVRPFNGITEGWEDSQNSAIIYFSNGDEGNSTFLPNEENWNELKQEKIIYGDLWISNSNFFIGEPTDATRFEVYKKVTIQNSKTLQIAGNSNSNIKITSQTGGFVVKNTSALDFYANANFEENAFLTLESGSTLTLQDEVEIHVTEGSTLTYDENATVNFGINSKIFIENGGKLVLKNGNFTLNPANWVLNGGIVIDESELSLNSFPDFEILTENKKEQ